MKRPYPWLDRLLGLFLDAADREEILGDLHEEHGPIPPGIRGSGRIAWATLGIVVRLIGSRLLGGIGNDFRIASRRLVTDPGFAALTIGALALGAGVNAAVFTVADAVLFAPLPYPDGARLGVLSSDHTGSATGGFGVAFENVRDLAERADTVERAALFLDWQDLTYQADGAAFRLPATFADQAFFELMGLRTQRGRLIGQEDNRTGVAAPVAVLSHGAWTRLFGADPDIVGRVLHLNDQPTEIIGVLEDDRGDLRYRWGESPTAIFLPLFAAESLTGFDLRADRGQRYLNALVRVPAATRFEQAGDELAGISTQLAEEHPEFNEGWTFALEPLREAFFNELQTPARALLAGSLLVFLLVVVNLTSLLLIRAEGRVGEIAVRRALGARRWRVARLLAVESLVLSCIAGALAVVLAIGLVALTRSSGALELPAFARLHVGLGHLFLTAASTLAAGLVLGAVAAVRLLAADPRGRTGRSSPGRRPRRIGGLLIAAEVGLAFLLLFGAGLLLGSFLSLRGTNYGFETDDLLLARVDLPSANQGASELRQFAEDAMNSGARLPQVADTFIWAPNRLGHGNQVEIITRADRWLAFPQERIEASQHHVHPGTLAKLGISLLRGRDFSAADGAAEREMVPGVAIVSESVAAELWPGADPLGRYFETYLEGEVQQVAVIGVATDSRHRTRLVDPDGPQRDIYYPFLAAPVSPMTLALRLAPGAEVEATARAVRQLLGELAPSAPLFELATMGAAMRDEESRHRFSAVVVAFYAGLALGLAAIGLYGVLAHRVRSQRQELGIRLALGASPRQVHRAVLASGLAPVMLGVVAGAAASLPAGRLLAASLYGISAYDAATYLAVPGILLVVAVGALAAPARRAARTPAAVILRNE